MLSFSYLNQGFPFYRQVIKLTIPIVLQNLITSTLVMADTFMVGLLGEAEIAALTLVNIPLFVLQLFLFGTQSGTAILISQNWGKQNLSAIHQITGVSIWFSIIMAGSFAMILFCIPYEFLSLFSNEPAVVSLAVGYAKLIGFAFLLNGITLMYVGTYRSIGQPELGMYMLGLSMVLNVFLNWIFIYGNLGAPALGVTGAAVGTLLARCIEVLIMLGHYFTTKGFRLHLPMLLHPKKEAFHQFFRHCSMVVFNETAWGLGTAMFPAIMGHMKGSTEILAAMAISTNVERLVMVAGFALGNSTAIVIGRSIGGGTAKEKISDIGKCLSFLGFIVGFITGFFLFLMAHTVLPWVIVPLLELSTQSSQIAVIMIETLAIFCCFRTFNTVLVVGVLRGGGDLTFSMLADILPLWCVAIPLAVLFGLILELPILWVCIAMALEQFVKFFLGCYRLTSPIWIHDLTKKNIS